MVRSRKVFLEQKLAQMTLVAGKLTYLKKEFFAPFTLEEGLLGVVFFPCTDTGNYPLIHTFSGILQQINH